MPLSVFIRVIRGQTAFEENTMSHLINRQGRSSDATGVDLLLPFVRVNDVQTTPIPQLHVHLPKSVLVVSSNYEPAPFTA